MVVYLDMIFLVNLGIDGAILLTTKWIRKLRSPWWKIALSAFIGALYVVLMFFPPLSFMYTFFIKFAFSLVMVYVAFGFTSLQYFMRNLAAFYFINFITAGGIIGIHYLMQSPNDVMNGIFVSRSGQSGYGLTLHFWYVVLGFIATIWFYRKVMRSTERLEKRAGHFAEVKVFIDQYEAACTGLIDTGNQLVDPLTRMPVMIMEVSNWNGVLPEDWLKGVDFSNVDAFIARIGPGDHLAWQNRLRIVPYRGVNQGMRFLIAVKPDKVVVTFNQMQIETRKVLVALDSGKLCSDNSYHALIHPALVQQ